MSSKTVKTVADGRKLGLSVYIVIGLLVIFAVFFVLELVTFHPPVAEVSAEPVSATSYVAIVDDLLAGADPQQGAVLVVSYGCTACHREGAQNGVAPAFVGVAARAAERRALMTAASYIYESVIHPAAYIVEDYPNSMVQNFGARLTDRELGDIIAYLLTEQAG